tara:strand:+ start:35 stop:241 length:207 start_codon:yes stop_codon:yes gene_type:complete
MKPNSDIDYYFYTKTLCRFCSAEFPISITEEVKKEHIKKYHDDEMDFEDHVKAHAEKKCHCSGVDMST